MKRLFHFQGMKRKGWALNLEIKNSSIAWNPFRVLASGILDHTEIWTSFWLSILTLNLLLQNSLSPEQFGSAMVDSCDVVGNREGDGKDIACTSCDRQVSLHQSMGGGIGIQFSVQNSSVSRSISRFCIRFLRFPLSRIDVESVGCNRWYIRVLIVFET